MGNQIFVIEDDRDIQDALRDVLEMEGYRVEVPYNAEEALKTLSSREVLPDLILLDLLMAPMDGLTFRAEQMKDARLATIPTILMSADAHLEQKQMLIKPSACVKKPIDVDELLTVLKAVLTES